MAIRDRVRRALRKSEASDSSSQPDTNALATTTTTTNTSQSSNNTLEKTTTRLARVLTFGNSSNSDKENEAREKKKKREKKSRSNGRMHPRDKPLTDQNIRHQEMLSHFSMTFGASDPNQIETQSFMGVSPCCTRPGSRRPSISLDMTGSTTSFSTAAATDSTRE